MHACNYLAKICSILGLNSILETFQTIHLPHAMGIVVCLVCTAVASFAVLTQPAVAQGANTTLPFIYPGQVFEGDGSHTCPSEEQCERVRNEIINATRRLFRESVIYLLQPCGGGGWRRVAYLNMSDPSQQCPSVWQEITTPHRVCGSRSTNYYGSCEGVNYTTGSEPYDQVCGRIIGYQVGTPYCFHGPGGSIDSDSCVYVDGVSVTHGFPRQHIWTFATGLSEHLFSSYNCPCVNGSSTENNIPSFVGMNYFCESGLAQFNYYLNSTFWPDGDPLWDGQGCGPTSSCCTFNSPPWFNVQLSTPTTDDIEVRICG